MHRLKNHIVPKFTPVILLSSLLFPRHYLSSSLCLSFPAIQAIAYENKVAPETEIIFGDDFFDGLDIVCAALDNVEVEVSVNANPPSISVS